MANVTISDAITRGLQTLQGTKWRGNQLSARRNGWDRWQPQFYPDLIYWTDLLPGHIAEFHEWLIERLVPTTAHNYMNPIRKAAVYIHRWHPELHHEIFVRNVTRRTPRPKVKHYLLPDQLAFAIQQAHTGGQPAVLTALMFGGYAGLDIGEIMRVTAADIQGEHLTVRGEKNLYRPRVIPMTPVLVKFAQSWKHVYDRMMVAANGSLTNRARKILDGASAASGDKTFSMLTLHDATRVTFVNMAIHAGCEVEFLRAYIGHAPETTLDKHYGDLTPRDSDMPRVHLAKLEQLKRRVSDKLTDHVLDPFA